MRLVWLLIMALLPACSRGDGVPGLLGRWATVGFSNADYALDAGRFGTSGTASNVSWALGAGRYRYAFPPGNGFVDFGNVARYNFAGPFTVTAWVRVSGNGDANGTTYRALQKRGTGAPGAVGGWAVCVRKLSSAPELYYINNVIVDDGSGNSISYGAGDGGTGFAPETWVHVTVTFNGSTVLQRYLNGVADGGPATTTTGTGNVGNMSTSRNLTMGCAWDAAGTQSQFMRGQLADVRFYNRAISAAENKLIYLEGLP